MHIPHTVLDTLQPALHLQANEQIGVIADPTYQEAGHALAEVLRTAGYAAYVLTIPELTQPSPPLDEPVTAFLRSNEAVVAITEQSITHSKQTIEAAHAGTKIATMPGISPESFTKGAMTADFKALQKKTSTLHQKLEQMSTFRVEYKGHTITIPRKKRPLIGLEGEYPMNLPDGEVFFAPPEGEVDGEFIGDFFGKYGEDVYFKVDNGKLVEVRGATDEFNTLLEHNPLIRNAAELGIGTNDKALHINNVLEAEKIYGSVHIAFGTNTFMGGTVDAGFHSDAVMLTPTLIGIDDEGTETTLIQEGGHLLI